MFVKKNWIFFLIGNFSSLNATFEQDMVEDKKIFPMKVSESPSYYGTGGIMTPLLSLQDKNPDIIKKNDTEESISDTMRTVLALVIK